MPSDVSPSGEAPNHGYWEWIINPTSVTFTPSLFSYHLFANGSYFVPHNIAGFWTLPMVSDNFSLTKLALLLNGGVTFLECDGRNCLIFDVPRKLSASDAVMSCFRIWCHSGVRWAIPSLFVACKRFTFPRIAFGCRGRASGRFMPLDSPPSPRSRAGDACASRPTNCSNPLH